MNGVTWDGSCVLFRMTPAGTSTTNREIRATCIVSADSGRSRADGASRRHRMRDSVLFYYVRKRNVNSHRQNVCRCFRTSVMRIFPPKY